MTNPHNPNGETDLHNIGKLGVLILLGGAIVIFVYGCFFVN